MKFPVCRDHGGGSLKLQKVTKGTTAVPQVKIGQNKETEIKLRILLLEFKKMEEVHKMS